MPRIRSIHPGFWTDEAVVSVSRDARLLFIGLWNQCDDKGAFEWKPGSLKMRLFPSDHDLDVSALLNALEKAGLIHGYSVEGRKYGAVKNFKRFQRPKKPNSLFPMPDAEKKFSDGSELVGNWFPTGSEPVPHQFPTGSEPVPHQFPTGSEPVPPEGGRREEGRGTPPVAPPVNGRGGARGLNKGGKRKEPRNAFISKAAEIVADRQDDGRIVPPRRAIT
jgi:hypothetical protein